MLGGDDIREMKRRVSIILGSGNRNSSRPTGYTRGGQPTANSADGKNGGKKIISSSGSIF
jgi:hypothetical protein